MQELARQMTTIHPDVWRAWVAPMDMHLDATSERRQRFAAVRGSVMPHDTAVITGVWDLTPTRFDLR